MRSQQSRQAQVLMCLRVAASILKHPGERAHDANIVIANTRKQARRQLQTSQSKDVATGEDRCTDSCKGLGNKERSLTLSATAMRSFSCLHTQTTGRPLLRDSGSCSHKHNRDRQYRQAMETSAADIKTSSQTSQDIETSANTADCGGASAGTSKSLGSRV